MGKYGLFITNTNLENFRDNDFHSSFPEEVAFQNKLVVQPEINTDIPELDAILQVRNFNLSN